MIFKYDWMRSRVHPSSNAFDSFAHFHTEYFCTRLKQNPFNINIANVLKCE